MADALCGPSNALQSFKQHTQVDRTLQQDRLTGPRHSPAQGFRSADPRTGSLDAEFAAFENAGPANPFLVEQPALPGSFSAFQPARQPGAGLGWATDFQNLRISNQPIPSQQFRTEAPLVRSNGWHNEFARQQSNSRSVISQGKQAVASPSVNQYVNQSYPIYQNNLNSGYGGMMPMSGMEQLQKPLFQQGQEEQMFDEAGFEDAFAQASKEAHDIATEDVSPNLARDEQRETSGSDLLHKDPIQIHPEHSDTEYDLPALSKMPSPVQYRIGSDAIPYKEQKARTIDQDNRDADELARTAGQLLNSVQHDTSDKFQNSQFLSLMRKIRDGKVRVQGEEFRAINDINNPAVPLVDSEQLHPGGRFYPEQSPTQERAVMSGGLMSIDISLPQGVSVDMISQEDQEFIGGHNGFGRNGQFEPQHQDSSYEAQSSGYQRPSVSGDQQSSAGGGSA